MNVNGKTSTHSDMQGDECHEADGNWRTSSRSLNGETCVEVSRTAVVQVRDTKDRDRGMLAVTGRTWAAFLGLAKD